MVDIGPIENPRTQETIYQFDVLDMNLNLVSLRKYAGYVCIIVNTASKWGKATENYVQLQEIYNQYEERGLRILAFPCNQFMQEPKSHDEIRKFVQSFDVTYDLFAKVKVTCCGQHPLFSFLSHKLGRCYWNFTKYLIDRKGVPRMKFGLKRPPVDMVKDIERLLEEGSRKGRNNWMTAEFQ